MNETSHTWFGELATHWTGRYLAGACLLSAITSLACADVLPPRAREAEQRFAENQDVFDRTDQYCRNRKLGMTCDIPGTAFAGGGKGACKRAFVRGAQEIDLRCVPLKEVEIDRRVPDGAFRRDQRRCDGTPENPGEDEGYGCIDPPPVADRFCAGRKQDDPCTAVFTVAGKEQGEVGHCGMTVEQRRYYQYGYRDATRRVLLCLPKSPVPPVTFKPVPLTSKLRPW